MIIVEGPDNAGKTTLCNKLSKDLGLTVVHSERPKPGSNPVNHSINQIAPWGNIILDRCYAISEYVYGRIVRNRVSQTHGTCLVDLMYRPHLFIYCRPRDSVILENPGEQMDGVISNHEKIIKEYDQLMEDLARFGKGRIIRYDRSNYESVLPCCKDHIEEYQSILNSADYLMRREIWNIQ